MKRLWSTDAIVLSRFDLGEADRVLTLITPHEGKLKAIAKGVRRPTSRLGGSVEPFAELRLQLAHGRTFDVVTQVSVGHAWLALRDSLESTATAWYLAELADRSLEERHPAEPLYTPAQAGLRAARRGHAARPGRPLVRDAPDRRAGHAARSRPLRRMRPDARAGRHVPLGAAARRRPVRARSGPAGRADGPQPRRRSSCSRPTSASTSPPSPACACRPGPSARSRPRCAISSGSASSAMPARCPSSTWSGPAPARGPPVGVPVGQDRAVPPAPPPAAAEPPLPHRGDS